MTMHKDTLRALSARADGPPRRLTTLRLGPLKFPAMPTDSRPPPSFDLWRLMIDGWRGWAADRFLAPVPGHPVRRLMTWAVVAAGAFMGALVCLLVGLGLMVGHLLRQTLGVFGPATGLVAIAAAALMLGWVASRRARPRLLLGRGRGRSPAKGS